jgi:4-amino-4-deoxy-L-arabinose transferase-like glycosyltransferase
MTLHARLRAWIDPYLIAALAVGLLLRLAWLLYIDVEPFSDAAVYFGFAERLEQGLGYTFDGVNPTAYYPVGYPATLAGVFSVFGSNDFSVELLNLLAALVAIVATYSIALQVFDRGTARLAAFLVALLPSHILVGSLAFSEPLFTAVFLVACALVVAALRRPVDSPTAAARESATPALTGALFVLPEFDGPRAVGLALLAGAVAGVLYLVRRGRWGAILWAVAGAATGYAMLIRPAAIWLVVAGLVCLFLARRIREGSLPEQIRPAFVPAAAFLAGVALLTVPWLARNWQEFGVGTNLSTNGSMSFLVGNHEGANGCYHWNAERYDYLWSYGERERERKALEEVADFYVHNPGEALALVPRRMDCMWQSDTASVYWNQVSAPDPPSEAAYQSFNVASNWYYFALLGLAFLGVPRWLSSRPDRLLLVLVAGLTFVYYLLILGDQRYHQPLLPIVAIWSACGIALIPRWLKIRTEQRPHDQPKGDVNQV